MPLRIMRTLTPARRGATMTKFAITKADEVAPLFFFSASARVLFAFVPEREILEFARKKKEERGRREGRENRAGRKERK